MHRRHFMCGLTSGLTVLAAPAVAGPGRFFDLVTLDILGTRLTRALRFLPASGEQIGDRYRIRLPAAPLFQTEVLSAPIYLSRTGVSVARRMAEILVPATDWRADIVGHLTLSDEYLSWLHSRSRAEAFLSGLTSRSVDPARLRAGGFGRLYPDPFGDRIEVLISPV